CRADIGDAVLTISFLCFRVSRAARVSSGLRTIRRRTRRHKDDRYCHHYAEQMHFWELTLELSGGAAVRLDEELDGCDAARSGDDVGARRTRSLSNRLPQKLPALKAQTCDDAARNAAATDDKPERSWAKHTIRRTNTSYRLTLELSGGVAVRLERVVRPHSTLSNSTLPCSTRLTLPKLDTYAEHLPSVLRPLATPSGAMHEPWHSLEFEQTLPESVVLRSQVFALPGYGRPSVVQLPPLAPHSASVCGMDGFVTVATSL